jgi:hypothetical protein
MAAVENSFGLMGVRRNLNLESILQKLLDPSKILNNRNKIK